MRRSCIGKPGSLRMMARLMHKPLNDWEAAVREVRRRGYDVWEEWASPVIGGKRYEVRLRSDYPDARAVVVGLHRRPGGLELLREGKAPDLWQGVRQAVVWLDEMERPRARGARGFFSSPMTVAGGE